MAPIVIVILGLLLGVVYAGSIWLSFAYAEEIKEKMREMFRSRGHSQHLFH